MCGYTGMQLLLCSMKRKNSKLLKIRPIHLPLRITWDENAHSTLLLYILLINIPVLTKPDCFAVLLNG